MGAQAALSLILLIDAGLMLRSFTALHATGPGLVITAVVASSVPLPASRYREYPHRPQLVKLIIDLLAAMKASRQLPSSPLPLGGFGSQTSFAIVASARRAARLDVIDWRVPHSHARRRRGWRSFT